MTRALLAWLCWCGSYFLLDRLVNSMAVQNLVDDLKLALYQPNSLDELQVLDGVVRLVLSVATSILPALLAIGVYEGRSVTVKRCLVGWVCLGLAFRACYRIVYLACELAYFQKPFQLVLPTGFLVVVFTVAALVAFALGMLGYRNITSGRRPWLSALLVGVVFVCMVAGERYVSDSLNSAARMGTPTEKIDPELES